MSDPIAFRAPGAPGEPPRAGEPPSSYAGRTRYTQLEYEAILANASIGIAFTRDRKIFLCNPRFSEMFGFQPDELIGRPGSTIYPSRESYEALGQIAIPTLASGGQLDLEWELQRKDGSTFMARLIAKSIDAQNTQQGTIWIIEDITERKRHLDEVDRLLREQRATLESASIGISFVQERRILRCNRRYEEMYGYGPGELIGQPTSLLYTSQQDYLEAGRAYEEMSRGATFRDEGLRRRKDGKLFWVRASGSAVDPLDPQKGAVWVNEDITEQKHSEDELRRLLSEQQALLNNVVVGIAFVRERKVMRCNRRFEELFGYAPGQAQGISTRELYFTDQEFESRASSYEEIDERGVHQREQFLRRADGSGMYCRLSGRALEPGDPTKGYVWLFEDITERKRTDESLQRVVREQTALLDSAMIGIVFVKDRTIIRCNRRFEELLAYGQGELLGSSTRVLYADKREFERGNRFYENVWKGETVQGTFRIRRKDGTEFRCALSGQAVQSNDPAQGSVWLLDDVTAEQEAEERVRSALAEQELILDNATIGIAFIRDRVYQRVNPRLHEMFGYAPGEMVGKSSEIIFPTKKAFNAAAARYKVLAEGRSITDELQLRDKDGGLFWCKVVGKAIDPARPHDGSIWIYEDITHERAARQALERAVSQRTAELKAANLQLESEITERKQAEERARHLADHDALTGLPNRRLLEDRLTQALALSYRNRKQTAVMFIDLDRFKLINDSLGHAVGDVLLQEVAGRLVKLMRVGDTICRIGGDEFVIVLPEIKRSSDAANVAQKVIEQLSAPVVIDGRDLHVTPSIGISVFPDDGRDAEMLIRNADAAMYHAKEMGRANYQFFTDQMNLSASRRLTLENDLRRALQKGELAVYYQPVTELKAGCVAAHEALVRWHHPNKGLVSPDDFIQLAEETGLIVPIGAWVLREACRWATFIGIEHGLPVSVNLSARQFADPKLVETVSQALRETGLPAPLLELEITESTAMQQTDLALATMNRLTARGVSIAIDDFGTGYSSLAYLKRFPVDKIKIDRSFVADLPGDKDAKSIVAAIIALAHALNIRVVAEGVETEEQLEFLETSRCDFIQGYLAGPPVDADAAAKEYI